MALTTKGLKKPRKRYGPGGRLIRPPVRKKPGVQTAPIKKKPVKKKPGGPQAQPAPPGWKPPKKKPTPILGAPPKKKPGPKPPQHAKPTPVPNKPIKKKPPPKKGGFAGYVKKHPDLAKAYKKHKAAGGKSSAAAWGKRHYEKHGKKEKRKLS